MTPKKPLIGHCYNRRSDGMNAQVRGGRYADDGTYVMVFMGPPHDGQQFEQFEISIKEFVDDWDKSQSDDSPSPAELTFAWENDFVRDPYMNNVDMGTLEMPNGRMSTTVSRIFQISPGDKSGFFIEAYVFSDGRHLETSERRDEITLKDAQLRSERLCHQLLALMSVWEKT